MNPGGGAGRARGRGRVHRREPRRREDAPLRWRPTRLGAAGMMLAAMSLVFAACGSSGTTSQSSASQTGGSGSAGASGWPVYGLDLSNTRANLAETAVTASSVHGLASRWSINGLVGVVGTPVVANGVAYFVDLTGTVRAVRPSNGQVIWQTKITPGSVSAAAVSGAFVYAASGNMLFGIDRTTGAVRWRAVTNTSPFAQIAASPVVVDNRVVIGTASDEVVVRSSVYTFQGTLGAFDATTGKQDWNLVTTPNDATSGAGEGIWSTAAVDTNLGLLYVGTGQNLAPPPGPLEDSLIAVDYRTGKIRWSAQGFRNDVFSGGYPRGFDYDYGASPNLWTSNGRELVGDGEKSGTYTALDAVTGKPVWRTALSPGGSFGGALGSGAFVDGRLIVSANMGNASPEASRVMALDPRSGAIEWSHGMAGHILGPVSAVRGVAFVSTDAGELAALDTSTGATLWSYTAPGPAACGPSIVDGNVLWGYGFTLFKGPGPGGVISFGVPGAGASHQAQSS